MSKKLEYEMTLQTQLDELSTEIERHKAQVDNTEADAEQCHQEQFEVLQEKHKLASKKLGELRASSNGAWEEIENGIVLAWEPVLAALKITSKRFE